jgi:hypothetical protein
VPKWLEMGFCAQRLVEGHAKTWNHGPFLCGVVHLSITYNFANYLFCATKNGFSILLVAQMGGFIVTIIYKCFKMHEFYINT